MHNPGGGSSVVVVPDPEPDSGPDPGTTSSNEKKDHLTKSIITLIDDDINDSQLVISIDSEEYGALTEESGGWYNGAQYLGDYVTTHYGDKFVDERTCLGIATEAYIHYYPYNVFLPYEGTSDFNDKLIIRARVLNVVFENDDSSGRAEQIAYFLRRFPEDAEVILAVSGMGYVGSKLLDPEEFIQND